MTRRTTLGARSVKSGPRRANLGQPAWPSNFGGGFIWGPRVWTRPMFPASGMISTPVAQAPSGMIRG